jgi:hypothetical protein
VTVSQRGTPVIATSVVTGTAYTVTGVYPTGSVQTAGDLLVAVVSGYGSGTCLFGATPAGWTQVDNTFDFGAGTQEIGIYTKIAAGGDAAPVFTATMNTITTSSLQVVMYDLFDGSGGTPQVITGGSNFGTTGTITVTTSGNVPSAGCFAISGAITSQGTTLAASTWTTPASWTLGATSPTGSTLASQMASYTFAGPPSGSTLACLFTHSRTSTLQTAVSIVVQPPAARGMSVIATSSGAGLVEGLGLTVKVVTGAVTAPVGTTGSANAVANVSVNPAATGSWIYGANINDSLSGAWTPETGITFSQNDMDTYNGTTYGTFRTTGTTTAATPVLSGASDTITRGGVAAAEIKAAGTLAEDASSPNLPWSASATSIQTSWFVPPPGALLVAMVSSSGMSAAQVSATVTDTAGLAWTQVAVANTSGGGYAGVWLASVPTSYRPVMIQQAVKRASLW